MLRLLFSSWVLILLFSGCGSKAPEPLKIEEIPPVLRKTFTSAQLFVRQTAETVAKQVENSQFAAASIQLQAVMASTSLSKEQRDIASRALIAINLKVQEVAESISAPTPEGVASKVSISPEAAMESAVIQRHYILTK